MTTANDAAPPGDTARLNNTVQLQVNSDTCVGVGQCEMLEPGTFRLDDDDGVSVARDGAVLTRVRADAVMDKCPSGAITERSGTP